MTADDYRQLLNDVTARTGPEMRARHAADLDKLARLHAAQDRAQQAAREARHDPDQPTIPYDS